MNNSLQDLLKLFNPKTDIFAIIIIVLGLGIAIFLDGLAVKLIGACLMILSGVALFTMISQRAAATPPTPKFKVEQPNLSFTSKVDPKTNTKRMIFDGYETSFGGDDIPEEVPSETQKKSDDKKKEEKKADTPKTEEKKSDEKKHEVKKDEEKKTSQTKEQSASAIVQPTTSENAEPVADDVGETGFRIVAKKKRETPPATVTEPVAPKPAEPVAQQPVEPVRPKAIEQEQKPTSPKGQPVETQQELPPDIEQYEPTASGGEYFFEAEEYQDQYAYSDEEREIEEPVSHKRKHFTIQLSEFAHEITDSVRNEPRKEFDFLLRRVLFVIKSVIPARTAAFFWVNPEAGTLLLETRVSEAEQFFMQERSIPLANDIVSQIATAGLPQILSEITAEAECELLPYYQHSAGTRSFVGVPVYYDDAVVGILLADDTDDDAYDAVSVGFLGNFTKLIGGLIQSYTEKYDLLHSARALQAIDSLRSISHNDSRNIDKVASALLHSMENLVPYTSMGIITFNETEETWQVSAFRSKIKDNVLESKTVDLHSTFAGRAVLTGEHVHYSTLPPEGVRVHLNEATFRDCEFLALPIRSMARTHGALFIETQRPGVLTNQDLRIFELLAETAGGYLEQIHTNTLLSSHTLLDEDTSIANVQAFSVRIEQEFDRATDMKQRLTACVISLDPFTAPQFKSDIMFRHHALVHVVAMVQKHLRSFDLIGRLQEQTLGVALIQKEAREAQMWAERVRREIAGSLFTYQNKQFAVTVNIGIAELTRQKDFNELMENALQAGSQAKKKTNSVAVYD